MVLPGSSRPCSHVIWYYVAGAITDYVSTDQYLFSPPSSGLYKVAHSPPNLDFFLSFPSPSLCKGVKRYSEDSSEYAFLLVENLILTTPFGTLVPDGNFWHHKPSLSENRFFFFHCFGSLVGPSEEGFPTRSEVP